jgi:hypothetical protein
MSAGFWPRVTVIELPLMAHAGLKPRRLREDGEKI